MAVSASLYEGYVDYKGPKDKHVSWSDFNNIEIEGTEFTRNF